MNMDGLYRLFLGSHKPRTRAAYEYDVKHFADFLGVPTPEAAVAKLFSLEAQEANEVLAGWSLSMVEAGLKASTINRRLSALRGLSRLAMKRGLPWTLLVRGVNKTEGKRDMSGPDLDTVRRLFAHCDSKVPTAASMRNTAIVRLLYGHALRRFEVTGLDLSDVDLKEGNVRVLGKGRSTRKIMALSPSVVEALRNWIAVRGRDPGALFTSFDPAKKGDGRLDGSSVRRIVKRLGEEIGITLWPNALRHSSITTALDLTDGNLSRVMGFTRHKTPSGPLPYDDKSDQRAGNDAGDVADLVDEGLEEEEEGE